MVLFLQNVNLYELNDDSVFFIEIDNLIQSYKPSIVTFAFIVGIFQGLFAMLTYSAITYLFLTLMLRANRFMKRGQLFKMLIFSSTAVVVAEALLELFNITGILVWLFLMAAFIPLYILEREIANRIKIKIFGDGVINNPSVMDKINKAIQDKEENENNNDIIDIDLNDNDDTDDNDEDL